MNQPRREKYLRKLNRQMLDKVLIERTGQFPEQCFRLDIFTHLRKFFLAKKH